MALTRALFGDYTGREIHTMGRWHRDRCASNPSKNPLTKVVVTRDPTGDGRCHGDKVENAASQQGSSPVSGDWGEPGDGTG